MRAALPIFGAIGEGTTACRQATCVNQHVACLLQASLSAKAAELDASQARMSELELQLAQAMDKGTANSQRLATLQVRRLAAETPGVQIAGSPTIRASAASVWSPVQGFRVLVALPAAHLLLASWCACLPVCTRACTEIELCVCMPAGCC